MNAYYTTLGIAYGSSHEEIKKAFRALAHRWHPDKPGGNATKFKEINNAYQELMKIAVPPKQQPREHFNPNAEDFYNSILRQQAEMEQRRRSNNFVFYNGRWYYKI